MNTPAVIAENYVSIGQKKTEMSFSKTLVLAILAGAYIALAGVGATLAAVSITQPSVAKLISGCVFPAGLAMVILAGSELFTGNCLLSIPLLQRRVTPGAVLRNWGIVYLGNFIGALLISALVVYGHTFSLCNGQVAQAVVAAGQAKVSMSFLEAFFRGILCNFLVCLAVWIAFAADTVSGKILGLFFPIMLFVLCGFEHSVANMYYIPAAIFTCAEYGLEPGALNWGAFVLRNLLPVTLGNIVGGAGCVGAVYWFVYLKDKKENGR